MSEALLRGDTSGITNGSVRRAAICGATNTRHIKPHVKYKRNEIKDTLVPFHRALTSIVASYSRSGILDLRCSDEIMVFLRSSAEIPGCSIKSKKNNNLFFSTP